MYHYSVRTCFDICPCTVKCILHSLFKDQTFNPRNYHEIISSLRILAGPDFLTEVFYAVLRLADLGSEQAVFLQTGLVLNDNRRNAHLRIAEAD